MRLDGKVALVTGVIGAAIALRLAEAGADVIIVARRAGPLAEAAREMSRTSGSQVVAVTGDVGQPDSVRSILEGAESAFGRIDVLVNNTFAIGGEAPVIDLEVDDWDEPWRVNVMGPFMLSKGCARRMLAAGEHRKFRAFVDLSRVTMRTSTACQPRRQIADGR